MELVGRAGGTPYISFKDNTTAANGGLFAMMFHLYNLNQDKFLSLYHKRSNVETKFSMIKAKFGDALRSKRYTAMINETLAKILCPNTCCLIQSHYELGIEATFWRTKPVESKAIECCLVPEVDKFADAMAWI